MERAMPIRRHTRYPVCWPMRYGTDRFVAEGTVLDITEAGWRLAGPVPVQPGTQIWIQVPLPGSLGEPQQVRGTVLWTKGWEYALSIDAPPFWIGLFLNHALSRSLYRPSTQEQPPCRPDNPPAGAAPSARHTVRRRAPWQCRTFHRKRR